MTTETFWQIVTGVSIFAIGFWAGEIRQMFKQRHWLNTFNKDMRELTEPK